MDTALTPDYYEPTFKDGKYIDKLTGIWPDAGMKCPCGSRKDFCYSNKTKWSSHIKTQKHKAWLSELSSNTTNHYTRMLKAEEIIESQKKLLTQCNNKISQQELIIESLTHEIMLHKKCPVEDLLN